MISKTYTPNAAMSPARPRMFTGAFAVAICADRQRRVHGTGVSNFGYTPVIVDVVANDLPGVHAWSPPV